MRNSYLKSLFEAFQIWRFEHEYLRILLYFTSLFSTQFSALLAEIVEPLLLKMFIWGVLKFEHCPSPYLDSPAILGAWSKQIEIIIIILTSIKRLQQASWSRGIRCQMVKGRAIIHGESGSVFTLRPWKRRKSTRDRWVFAPKICPLCATFIFFLFVTKSIHFA